MPWLIVLVGIGGCQITKDYHDSLIETSLISEIPTLAGNLVGGIAGLPFLVVSAPIGYAAYPSSSPEKIAPTNRGGGQQQSHGIAEPSESQPKDRSGARASAIDNSQKRKDFILAPVYAGSYTFGTLLGTPFFPFALLFPRERPIAAK